MWSNFSTITVYFLGGRSSTSVYEPDGRKFAEINRNLNINPKDRIDAPDFFEKESFNLTLYGSNNKSVNLDAEGFREIQKKFRVGGQAPADISESALSRHLDSFAAGLPIVKVETEAKNLAKELGTQIAKNGINSLEHVIEKYTSKLMRQFELRLGDLTYSGAPKSDRERDYRGVDINSPMVISKISEKLPHDFTVKRTKEGFEFSQLDSQGKTIRSASYYADGFKSGETEFDENGKTIKEKIFVPRK